MRPECEIAEVRFDADADVRKECRVEIEVRGRDSARHDVRFWAVSVECGLFFLGSNSGRGVRNSVSGKTTRLVLIDLHLQADAPRSLPFCECQPRSGATLHDQHEELRIVPEAEIVADSAH